MRDLNILHSAFHISMLCICKDFFLFPAALFLPADCYCPALCIHIVPTIHTAMVYRVPFRGGVISHLSPPYSAVVKLSEKDKPARVLNSVPLWLSCRASRCRWRVYALQKRPHFFHKYFVQLPIMRPATGAFTLEGGKI